MGFVNTVTNTEQICISYDCAGRFKRCQVLYGGCFFRPRFEQLTCITLKRERYQQSAGTDTIQGRSVVILITGYAFHEDVMNRLLLLCLSAM